MAEKVREVVVKIDEDACRWLENVYGKDWVKRLEQHIANEVHLRSSDALKSREPWDY